MVCLGSREPFPEMKMHMSANAKDNLLEGITDYIKRVIGEIAEISLVSVPRDMYNLG